MACRPGCRASQVATACARPSASAAAMTRFQLVDVTERGERAVQQVVDRPVKRAAERAGRSRPARRPPRGPTDSRSQVPAGMLRSASPYRPHAAAMAPTMIAIGVLTMAQPAGSHGVPRLR